jgi:adenylate cyclase class 2
MSQNNNLEVEAKLLVPNLDAVRACLEADAEARQTKPRVYEYNIRYEDAAESMTPRGIVLRLRRDRPVDDDGADRVRLTYKAPPEVGTAITAGAKTAFEAEVEVDNFEQMDVILQRLGYHKSVVYEKYRTTYTLAGAEVVLDEMPFGMFVEIEGAPAAIEPVVARLGLESAQRFTTGYLSLFWYAKLNLGLTFDDLTFENFRGIDVPPEAFAPPVS